MIRISVFYASATAQKEIALQVEPSCTVALAIARSKMQDSFPEIDLAKNKVGVFGKFVTLNTLLNDGDRIEIYRPLLIDPKELRRKKAKQ